MSEISNKADTMTDFLVGASVAFGRSNDPHFQEKIGEAVTQLHDYIASLEFQLADAQARLAGYEVGYDPKVKLPEPLTIEWRGYPVFVVIDINGYTHICDAYSKEYGFRATQGERVQFYSVDKVLRWFPLPDAKEEK